jgi:hypothetical protein
MRDMSGGGRHQQAGGLLHNFLEHGDDCAR